MLGRWACATCFFVSGYVMGSWAPQIPELALRLEISEGAVGIVILALGAGSLLGLPLAGVLTVRFGSRPITVLCALALSAALLLMTLAPSLPAALAVAFYLGLFGGGLDVAMNANAVTAERRLAQPVTSSMHGFWSLGALFGAAAGGFLIVGIGTAGHALTVLILGLALVALAGPYLLDDEEPASPSPAVPRRFAFPRSLSIYLIGFLALLAMEPEGAVLDWSALYLRQELGAGVAFSGFGFAAFSLAMTGMRFAGDAVRARYGAVSTLRVSAVVAGCGLLLAGLGLSPLLALAGFFVAGLGTANLVPIAFSAAGNYPGVPSGIGLTVVTTLGYTGLLVVPALIGFVAERTGFAVVFMGLAAVFSLVLMLSRHVVHADSPISAREPHALR